MTVEHRAGAEFRVSGRTLSGVAMVYGDVAPEHRERFMPGALRHGGRIDVCLQHDSSIVLARGALLTDTARELRVRADLAEGSAALALVKRGALNGFSIEFHARAERREAGIRVVERADLTGLALVDQGAYPGATAEVRRRKYTKGRPARIRAGRVLRSKIPYDTALACECLKQGRGAECIPLARFSHVAGETMQEMIADALGEVDQILNGRDILAVSGNYRRPIGSASRGSLRAVSTDDALEIEIDVPAGTVGDDLVAAHESAGVIVRPLIDFDKSEFTDGPDGRTYSKPHLRAILVGATDEKAGWPVPRIGYDGDDRAAPEPARRRALWL